MKEAIVYQGNIYCDLCYISIKNLNIMNDLVKNISTIEAMEGIKMPDAVKKDRQENNIVLIKIKELWKNKI